MTGQSFLVVCMSSKLIANAPKSCFYIPTLNLRELCDRRKSKIHKGTRKIQFIILYATMRWSSSTWKVPRFKKIISRMCEDRVSERDENRKEFQKPFNKSFFELELCAEGIFLFPLPPQPLCMRAKLINYVSKLFAGKSQPLNIGVESEV